MAGRKGPLRKSVASDARQRAWTSMRVHREFTIPMIQATSDTSYNNLLKFVQMLERCGYLVRLATNQTGHAGSYSSFRLARDTGPRVPLTTKRNTALYDPNEDRVYDARPKEAS